MLKCTACCRLRDAGTLCLVNAGVISPHFPAPATSRAGSGSLPITGSPAARSSRPELARSKHRSATALRIAAQTLFCSRSALGDYARRMRHRLGPAKAITAVAHKLARIIYMLVTGRRSYDESVFAQCERDHLERAAARLRRQAEAMGFQLVATPAQ
jgi:transposase